MLGVERVEVGDICIDTWQGIAVLSLVLRYFWHAVFAWGLFIGTGCISAHLEGCISVTCGMFFGRPCHLHDFILDSCNLQVTLSFLLGPIMALVLWSCRGNGVC